MQYDKNTLFLFENVKVENDVSTYFKMSLHNKTNISYNI